MTSIITQDDGEPVVVTARNDTLLNGYNPLHLSSWRANVDFQYVVSRQKVVKYIAEYATKSEPRSQALQEIYNTIMKKIGDDGTPLKVVQRLLTSTVDERDFSAQETCHLLLMLLMFRASRDFIVLSLDTSRQGGDNLDEDKPITVDSQLDHYCGRPDSDKFHQLTQLEFIRQYKIQQKVGLPIVSRTKEVVVIPRPYCSPDPDGPHYEKYCRQKLLLHKPFRQLLDGCDTFKDAFGKLLRSSSVPASLADDLHQLEMAQTDDSSNTDTVNEVIKLKKSTVGIFFIKIFHFKLNRCPVVKMRLTKIHW